MSWLFLIFAIASETTGTMSLRASDGFQKRRWIPVVFASYLVSFGALTLTLANGMALGVAYGIWAASGVALTAVLAKVIFHEPLTRTMIVGIVLIATGVLVVELGANAAH